MITQVLHCPYCQGTDIVRHGTSAEGKQRYRCRECRLGRGRTFLLDYTYIGQSPEVKQQIVDMAMNASGIRDTARVLASESASTLALARHRSPHREGAGVCVWTTQGHRLSEAESLVGAVWHYALLHGWLGRLRTPSGR